MLKLPQFRFGFKMPEKIIKNLKVFKNGIITLKNHFGSLLSKRTILGTLAIIFFLTVLAGVFFFKELLIPAEPEVSITTEVLPQKDNLKIATPAETAQPDLSETPSFPEEENVQSTREDLLDEQTVSSPADLEDIQHPINLPPARGYGFTYSETFQDYRFHAGVDFKADLGTPVQAALSGKVEEIEYSADEGYQVILDHGSGWKTVYSHVGDVKVEKGDKVESGEELAVVAAPGKMESSLGPHLHFELRYKDASQDPLEYLPEIETH